MKKFLALTLVLCCLAGVAMADTFGMAVCTELTKASSATADAAGQYQVESYVCSVVLDDNGVIVDVWFDVTQVKLGFDAAGAIANEAGTVFPSKFEKKEAYGMGAYAPAGEWYVQARALEQFCIGKTVAEVLALPTTSAGALDVADLKTSCTIGVSAMLKALEAAAANAR